MNRRFAPTIGLLAAAFMFTAASVTSDPAALVVHEWGTFTSIAGPDGNAVEWAPQTGRTDLPCFVERSRFNIKGNLRGTVRMETPVLYFYAPHEISVDVGVQFRQGVMTEWFPPALVTPANGIIGSKWQGSIRWNHVRVAPQLAPEFRSEPGSSHYYRARNTDASPLVSGSEKERFLFYRGVGTFAPPIAAIVADDGSVTIRNRGGQALGDIIVFENRGGAMAYDVRHVATDRVTLTLAAPEDEMPFPEPDLERILVAHGLYAREASAMVETWRDSWFEEGVRVFYLVPPAMIESILPLDVEPRPTQVARVFVGRMELVTPSIQQEVKDALATNDRAALEKYGRFLQPIGARILASIAQADRAPVEQRLQSVYGSWPEPGDQCK